MDLRGEEHPPCGHWECKNGQLVAPYWRTHAQRSWLRCSVLIPDAITSVYGSNFECAVRKDMHVVQL